MCSGDSTSKTIILKNKIKLWLKRRGFARRARRNLKTIEKVVLSQIRFVMLLFKIKYFIDYTILSFIYLYYNTHHVDIFSMKHNRSHNKRGSNCSSVFPNIPMQIYL